MQNLIYEIKVLKYKSLRGIMRGPITRGMILGRKWMLGMQRPGSYDHKVEYLFA